ncbi:hypothetical protein Tco_0215629 [Tanacetum coccineum]
MGDANPIRTLGDYSKPSHEGYRNTIELPVANNVVSLKSANYREEGQISSKNVNSISLARGEEERNNDNDVATCDDIEKPTRTETGMPVNEAENGIKNEPIRKAKKEETTKAPNFMQ